MSRKIAMVLVLWVVFPGCEKEEAESGVTATPSSSMPATAKRAISDEGLPSFSSLTKALQDSGWKEFSNQLEDVKTGRELAVYSASGGGLKIVHYGDRVGRIQLGGGPTNVAEVIAPLIGKRWEKIQGLPSGFDDYTSGLTRPHVVSDLLATVCVKEDYDGEKYLWAFIVWTRSYYAEEQRWMKE